MKRLTETQKLYFVISLIVIGATAGFYYNFYKPVSFEIKRLKEDKKIKEQTLINNKKEAARLPYVEAESKRLKVELFYAEEVLPKDINVPYLLVTLTQLSFDNKVYFSLYSPGGIEERGDYAVYSISLPIVGTFHNIVRFICAVGNLPRLINVVDLSLSAIGVRMAEEEFLDTVSCPLRLEAYIYR
ncbi:TPA: hypothetical protein DCX16_05945 [bacterium]|nr:hypothetical protein [bacterium]